jgi:type I restriction enzyme S subunit
MTMVSGWRTAKLGELVAFKTGKLDSNAAVPDGDYPFFTCSQETLRTNTFSFDTECVLLAGNNANGIYPLKYFHGKFDAYQRTYVVKPRDTEVLTTKFLYYSLRPKLSELRSFSTGAATKFLTLTILNETEIELPPLPVQRKIAGILSAYDELIENSQRRIKILESMAHALYREWFVNFRFPNHEKVKFVHSPLGDIPKGWEVKQFGDLVNSNRRATKSGTHLGERRYVPIDCLPSKSLALMEAKPIEEAQSSLQLFEQGDILFGAMRPYFHKVAIAPFAGVTRTTCFVFKPKRPDWHAFATMTTFEESTIAYANAHSQGATIPYAVWDGSLAEMPLILPPDALLRRFEKIVAPMLAHISQSFFTLNNLRRTRDFLLPRLLSGQVMFEVRPL